MPLLGQARDAATFGPKYFNNEFEFNAFKGMGVFFAPKPFAIEQCHLTHYLLLSVALFSSIGSDPTADNCLPVDSTIGTQPE